jgi:hypothetical protein
LGDDSVAEAPEVQAQQYVRLPGGAMPLGAEYHAQRQFRMCRRVTWQNCTQSVKACAIRQLRRLRTQSL